MTSKYVPLDFILKLKQGPFTIEWETNELEHICHVSDKGHVDHLYRKIDGITQWRNGTIISLNEIFLAVSKKNARGFMFKCQKK